MPDLYETYIRTQEGDTFHPGSIQEGLDHFFSSEGYRISFNIDGVKITLRKNAIVDADMTFLDEQLGSRSVNCVVTVRP